MSHSTPLPATAAAYHVTQHPPTCYCRCLPCHTAPPYLLLPLPTMSHSTPLPATAVANHVTHHLLLLLANCYTTATGTDCRLQLMSDD